MVRKKTNVLYYASDGIEDDLHEWQLRTSSSTVVGSVYSLLGSGTDTAWETSTLYELDGNVFRPTNTKMFGSDGWLDSQGYGDVVYANCTKSSSFIRFSSSLYPRLQHAGYMVVPVTETETKYYLPVRQNSFLYEASDGYEGTLYNFRIQNSYSGILFRGYITTKYAYNSTAWQNATIYQLNGSTFNPKPLFGYNNSVCADIGYAGDSYNRTSSNNTQIATTTMANQLYVDDLAYTLPQTVVKKEYYLPVRKKNGTTKYYI